MSKRAWSPIVRFIACISVIVFMYCASPLFLPVIYVTTNYTEDYARIMPRLFFVLGYMFLVCVPIAEINIFRLRTKAGFCFGVFFWSVLEYSLALFLFRLPIITTVGIGVLTVFQAHVVGALLAFKALAFADKLFMRYYTEPEPEDYPRLPKRPKSLPPPKGTERL